MSKAADARYSAAYGAQGHFQFNLCYDCGSAVLDKIAHNVWHWTVAPEREVSIGDHMKILNWGYGEMDESDSTFHHHECRVVRFDSGGVEVEEKNIDEPGYHDGIHYFPLSALFPADPNQYGKTKREGEPL